jgi:hypothetical protein
MIASQITGVTKVDMVVGTNNSLVMGEQANLVTKLRTGVSKDSGANKDSGVSKDSGVNSNKQPMPGARVTGVK